MSQREISIRTVEVTNSIDNPVNVSQQVDPVIPDRTLVTLTQYFENGGSRSQLVDGSGTPVNFDLTIANNCIVYQMKILSMSIGVSSLRDYGSITGGLTNGIEITGTINGTAYTFASALKRWIDFGHASSSGIVSFDLKGVSSQDVAGAIITFGKDGLYCEAGSTMRVRIRDNLTSLDYQEASIQYAEI